MKNINNDNQEFDQELNKRFSEFSFNPDSELFDRIQSKMENDQFDKEVKNRFDEFSRIPSEKIWKSVEQNVPLHLGIRVQLQRLSRVAAVALFMMTGIYLYQVQQDHPLIASAKASNSFEEATISPAAKTDFVFEIPESVPMEDLDESKARKKLHKKKKSKEKGISDYLALILDEEDDFDEFIDHRKMREMLQPVEKLSPDFMSASTLAPLPRYASSSVIIQDIELNINIPLQVVEPHEIEGLLKMYEETQRAERD